ncbi:MAG: penicillin acylase family protein [Anaerolineae bacterium]
MLGGLIALAALAAPAAALAYFYRRPLPTVNGSLKAEGLRSPVEVIRDRWGVAHIYAQSQADLFFAQGYVHAQERLFQMDLHRRLASGRLAAVVGEPGFDTDRLLRTLGVARAAQRALEQADAETLAALEAYSAGVNACLAASGKRLPLEFLLLGYKPEPWRPVDTFAWGKLQALMLSSSWGLELLNAALIARLGPERAAQLKGQYPSASPLVLPGQTCPDLVSQALQEFRAARSWLPEVALAAMSNNWVVDGSKSTTGRPLLANDPHLALTMPSIWYENHLVCPELEVTGVSFPGTPAVVLGHNAHIAWGMTASFPDVQDVYMERLNPQDHGQYEYQGAWEQATIVNEEVRVKGEVAPRAVKITITRHGPIISELSPLRINSEHTALALRTVEEAGGIFQAMLRLNRARNWQEFTEALRHWDVPSQTFVYADGEGNIGLYVPGKVPIRAQGEGTVPLPGWTGEHEWSGWIRHEELPHAFNPGEHYLASANNQVTGVPYPYTFTAECNSSFRARRIVQLLQEKEKLSPDDFAHMQLDQYSFAAAEFCQLLTALAPAIMAEPALSAGQAQAKQALAIIGQWDHRLMADSVAAALYEVTLHFAKQRLFRPWLGDLTDYYLGQGMHYILPATVFQSEASYLVLQRMLANDERQWFRDEQGQPLRREAILALALADAIAYLSQAVGEDMGEWRWGRIHPLRFDHLLGAKKPLDRLFSRGPYPYGGDGSTICSAFFPPKLPISGSTIGASWRQIIDVGNWDASRAIHSTGQSGHPASKHYDDMISPWLKGEYHPMLWSRDKVQANAEARLVLLP